MLTRGNGIGIIRVWEADRIASDEALQLSTAEAWLGTYASPNTRAAYRLDLETFGRWCAQSGSIPIRADAATLLAFQAAREAAGDSAADRATSVVRTVVILRIRRRQRRDTNEPGARVTPAKSRDG